MRVPGYEFTQVGSIANDPLLDEVHGIILHVDGGNATSLLKWFDGPSGGIESHFFIPKSDEHDLEQFRDTNREADANFKANSWIGTDGRRHGFLSVETQGTGAGKWNSYQLEQLKRLIKITAAEHDFPLQPVENFHGKGVGYHTQFPQWTNVAGKTCPGPDRIKQYREIIVPWLLQEKRESKLYTVRLGDTVPEICDKFNIRVLDLWRWNDGVSLPLKSGMKLRVKK